MKPWKGWMHVTGSTYGQWLRGDPRGWRSKGHREHVEGDYRCPPPAGMYSTMYARSQALMKREGVWLGWEARVLVCRVMVEALRFHHVHVMDLCVGAVHYHVLARFVPEDEEVWDLIRREGRSQKREPRHLMGIAKKESARALSRTRLVEPGGVWAGGCGRRYIRNLNHFKRVVEYIPGHAEEGAAVYSLLFRR